MNLRTQYLAWSQRIVRERGARCESCGHTPAELGQARLHPHHLMTVHILGLTDPSVMDAGNVLVVCNACHSLFHPGHRQYTWEMAGKGRGRSLSR